MLALKDSDHIVRLTAYQLSERAKKTELEVLEALKILSSPDTIRREKQDFDGRRIKAVEQGWLVLNGEKYRDMVQLEMKRAKNRRAQQAFRDRLKEEKVKRLGPGASERYYEQNGEPDPTPNPENEPF